MLSAQLELTLRPTTGGYNLDLSFRFANDTAWNDLARDLPVTLDQQRLLEAAQDIAEYGRRLAAMLFAEPAAMRAWLESRSVIRGAQTPLRLLLRLNQNDPFSNQIRWEALRDPESDQPLAGDEMLSIVRSFTVPDLRRVGSRTRAAARTLLVIADPANGAEFGLRPVGATALARRLLDSLGGLSVTALIRDHDAIPTPEAVLACLRDADLALLAAHGLSPDGLPHIWLEDADGKGVAMPVATIAAAVAGLGQRPLLIVLASCGSAGDSKSADPLLALGPRLAAAGIPAVIAMQGDISVETAIALTTTLFAEVRSHGQIERALAAARASVLLRREDWWMPVLYSRLTDASIWEPESPVVAPQFAATDIAALLSGSLALTEPQLVLASATFQGSGVMEQLYGGAATQFVSLQDLSPGSLQAVVLERQLAFARSYHPPRSMVALFELVDEPDTVPAALFGRPREHGPTPSQVPYAGERLGTANVQAALDRALDASAGRLFVRGENGIGKTREVAELARRLAARGWTIGVATDASDQAMDALWQFPAELSDARLLLIIDDLQVRVSNSAPGQAPYLERLGRLISYLERRLTPESVAVVLIARSEPQFESSLGYEQQAAFWAGFTTYELPELTVTSLISILSALAAEAQVPLSAAEAEQLVANSDRKPATLFENVSLARDSGQPLNRATWLPSRGKTWAGRFQFAQRRFPKVGAVYQILALLRSVELSAREPYVLGLSVELAGEDTQATLDGLIDMGLLQVRHGTLSPYSDEQLTDSLRAAGQSVPELDTLDEVLARLVKGGTEAPAWPEDCIDLAMSLFRTGKHASAEELATLALASGAEPIRAHLARGLTYFARGAWAACEADFTAALVGGAEDARLFGLRGSVRFFLGDFSGQIEDLDAAIARGLQTAMVYSMRGWAYYLLGRPEAGEADYDVALAQEPNAGWLYWGRMALRQARGDMIGAEADISEVIERGIDLQPLAVFAAAVRDQNLSRLGALPDLLAGTAEAPVDGAIYALRGSLRLRLKDYAGVEADITTALERGIRSFIALLDDQVQLGLASLQAFSQSWSALRAQWTLERFEADLYAMRGVARFNLARYTEAEADFDQAVALGADAALIYALRAIVRHMHGAIPGAEADYSIAIGRGLTSPDLLIARGGARLVLDRAADAVLDYDAAIAAGNDSAAAYLARGSARLSRGDAAGAEADLNAAIARGRSNSIPLLVRSAALLAQGRLAEAEADLQAALAGEQKDASFYGTYGAVLLTAERFAEAEAALTTALAQEGAPSPPLLVSRGAARYSLGSLAEAEQDLTAAIAGGLATATAYAMRFAARADQGDFAGAEADATVAISLGRDDHLIYAGRGEARRRLRRYAEAEADFTEAIARGYDDAEPFLNRGVARFSQKKYAEAEPDFDAAIARGVDSAFAYYGRGVGRAQLGRLAEAETDLSAAIARDPDDGDYSFMRGALRFDLKQYLEAEPDLTAAIDAGIRASSAYFQRGFIYLLFCRLAEARADFERVLAQTPDDATTLYLRGAASVGLGELDAAVTDFDAAIATGDQNPELLYAHARASLWLNRLEQAEANCARITQLAPAAPEAHACRAMLSLHRGDHDSAISELQSALQLAGGEDWHRELGVALLLAGRFEAAIAEVSGAAQLSDSTRPFDLLISLHELRFWTASHADRLTSPAAQHAVAEISRLLEAGRVRHEWRTRG